MECLGEPRREPRRTVVNTTSASSNSLSTAAALGLRRSTRVKSQRCYNVSFPAITDTMDDEDDGVEYNYRWQDDEF